MVPRHIAVLGGGIAGLTSAFHLSRRFPTSLVTLLEKENRFGGWVRSDRVEVDDGKGNQASVLLEAGPRTLRPGAKGVMELVSVPLE
jgi:protoporphyrinogen/coproporphyrinogen III oxidase